MTGWRMGWSVWPDGLKDHVRKLAVNAWSCVNAPAQMAGIAAIDGSQDAVDKMMLAFDKRRNIVVEKMNAIPNVTCATPKGAFYAFPNISATGWKAKDLASALLEEAHVATSVDRISVFWAKVIFACPMRIHRKTSSGQLTELIPS